MQGVAVHWEAGHPRLSHSDCAAQVEEIRHYHKTHGYSDIAYNMLGCQHGGIFTGRGWGRPSGANGTTWANLNIWAVCWMSGPGHPFTDGSKQAMGTLIDEALRRSTGPKSVEPHSYYFNTACPGDDVRVWLVHGWPHGGLITPVTRPRKAKADMDVIVETGKKARNGLIQGGFSRGELGGPVVAKPFGIPIRQQAKAYIDAGYPILLVPTADFESLVFGLPTTRALYEAVKANA